MLCRMGFMTVLLVWSGWGEHVPQSWLLLSLPLTDALLSILPLYWPQVLKIRAYPYVVHGIHRLYGLTLGILFFSGLSAYMSGASADLSKVRLMLFPSGLLATLTPYLQSLSTAKPRLPSVTALHL